MAPIQGFSRFVRRTANPDRVVAFYEQALGFPVIRRSGDSTIFWVGNTRTLAVLPGPAREPARESHLEPMAMVIRVYDFDQRIATLDAIGVHYVERREHEHSRVAYIHDPDGNLVGLQERKPNSPRVEDVHALERWNAGDRTVDGMPALGDGVQHLGWVLLPAENPGELTTFYATMLGLDIREQPADGRSRMSFGDDMILLILDGGHRKPAPPDPIDTWLARGRNVVRTAEGWKKQGVQMIGDPVERDGATHVYFTDPEGNLFGLRETTTGLPEDIEAGRRRL